MIVTLTPNPSVDRTAALSAPLERGAVLRAESVISQAGGKGVNISRAAVAAGLSTIAVLPADSDDPYVLELLRDGVDCRPEPPAGPVRVNLTISEPDGTTTKINTPGAVATAESLDRLAAALQQRAQHADWVVLAGSLPPGAPADWYATLVRSLRSTTARVAVDTSDEPLAALAARFADSAPDVLKPNGEELASLSRTTRPPRRRRLPCSWTRAWVPCSPPSERRGRCWPPRPAPGTPRHRRPRS
jgi:1-phosphofructokinase